MELNNIVLGELPDEILDWHGTAAELAEKCNTCLPLAGLAEDKDTANERLIRHYVQMGVLDRPDTQGFGAQHVFDFLAARALLKDGWSLSKIGELRASRPDGLTSILPSVASGLTPAEVALKRLKREAPACQGYHASARHPLRKGDVKFAKGVVMDSPPKSNSAPIEATHSVLDQAAGIWQRRRQLKSSLTDLGNPTGEVTRRRTVQLSLTSWCTVYIDAAELERSAPDTFETIGKALTQALHEERIRGGKKS